MEPCRLTQFKQNKVKGRWGEADASPSASLSGLHKTVGQSLKVPIVSLAFIVYPQNTEAQREAVNLSRSHSK